jgi:Icc-related predicted phosphoesterase
MKATFISDTHGKHNELKLTGGDLLIHAGDLSGRGLKQEIAYFMDWFAKQEYTYKVFIAGNHDFLFERDPAMAEALIPDNIIYLNDSATIIEGYKIWGSPITPYFYDWAFNRLRGPEIDKHWALIPHDTDILVTHGPPAKILDRTTRGDKVGCENLLAKIIEVKPKFHLFGHIHEARGTFSDVNTNYINASVLNELYVKVNDGVDLII